MEDYGRPPAFAIGNHAALRLSRADACEWKAEATLCVDDITREASTERAPMIVCTLALVEDSTRREKSKAKSDESRLSSSVRTTLIL